MTTITINGITLAPSEAECLFCAVTAFHSEMSDPLALGGDEHGRAMAKAYREGMARVLWLMGVFKKNI